MTVEEKGGAGRTTISRCLERRRFTVEVVEEGSLPEVQSIELVREPSGCEVGGAAPGGGGGALTVLSAPDDAWFERGMAPEVVSVSNEYD